VAVAVRVRVVLVVRLTLAQTTVRQIQRPKAQPLTQVQAAAAVIQQDHLQAQAVAEFATSGLRFNYGTFCKNRKRHSN
jgi:hypothetical protein